MMSEAKVLGNSKVGDHVIFTANSYVLDRDIPPYSIVFGSAPDNVVKPISEDKFFELVHMFC